MLTKHKYQNIADGWDQQKDHNVKDCCQGGGGDDCGCQDCCYDTWSVELKEVTQSYTASKEAADQLTKKLTFLLGRRDRYKTWLDELNKAEELSRAICHQLEIIAGQSEKIWYNTCKAVQAVEILFCMIREFFMQVDYLKTRYDELQTCITKNNDPCLEPGKGILVCLKNYYDKLDAVIKSRNDIIKSVVEAVRIANLVRNNIYTLECPGKDAGYDPCKPGKQPCDCNCDENTPSEYGFKTIICEWFCEFKCDVECEEFPCGDPCSENNKGPKQSTNSSNNPNQGGNTDPCDVNCDLKPTLEFPLCNNTYKCCVEKWYSDDDKKVKEIAGELKDLNKKKEALQACKQSLTAAMAEADPKLRCK